MIYDVLLLMLCTFFKGLFLNSCTFFKGLFALFCHFFKGLSVAKIQNFLLKGKENGNYFLFKCLIREKVVTFRMVKLNLLLSIFCITK